MSSSEDLSWDVTLPDRRTQSLGYGARPRAILTVSTPDRGEEQVSLPLSVGRLLKAKTEASEFHPGSRAELLYMVRELSTRCASLRVEKLVDKRDYSGQELSNKLAQDGFSASIRDAVVARAQDCGLVSDNRYAAAFIRSKLASGWGVMRIERELKERGIELRTVPGWPEEFVEEGSEEERAYAVASTRRIAEKNGFEKLVRFLCGRGFTMGCAMRVARRVIDEATG